MAQAVAKAPLRDRPRVVQSSQSYEKPQNMGASPQRLRASTLASSIPGETAPSGIRKTAIPGNDPAVATDVFDVSSSKGHGHDNIVASPIQDMPEGFEELPIELVSLTDRFLETLTAKVHRKPPTIEELSDMFQDLYAKAELHIATHIKTLSRRQLSSPVPFAPQTLRKGTSASMRSSSSRDTLNSLNSVSEQQMLTPEEIAQRRRARRLLEYKKVALEEAVERRVCERIYERIWRHKSTMDEAQDEKLKSRIAALALVGISLKELGVEADNENETPQHNGHDDISEDALEHARTALLNMNAEHSPSGKLQQLAACHKYIVDHLAQILGSSSSASADGVLPTLIYTLITSPPEGVNAMSNLQYIQRFRNANKIDGEAAYCLTNLEAAISFLETVDLASLRADELLEGPLKAKSTVPTLNPDMLPGHDRKTSSPEETETLGAEHLQIHDPLSVDTLSSPSRPIAHTRRSSNLLEPATNAIGVAGDAVKSTADQGLKTVSTALDTSFKFFFGRMKERQSSIDELTGFEALVPRTLDDARKLVEPKLEDDEYLPSETSSVVDQHMDGQIDGAGTAATDSLLNIFGGRQQTRDRSVDSSRSGGSGRKNMGLLGTSPLREILDPTSSPMNGTFPAASSAVDSMKNFGNAINPLNRFGGMGVMKGFGKRSPSGSVPLAPTSSEPPSRAESQIRVTASHATNSNHQKPLQLDHPPIARFLDIANATELKVGELEELLQDYKRLAAALARPD